MFKYFKKLDKVRLISEPIQKSDGFYFHIKIPCVVEPVTLSTRDLLSKYANQLSKEDKAIVINTFKMEVKYKLLAITDKEFLILDLNTKKTHWLDLTYTALKKLPENSLRTRDITKITDKIAYEVTSTNKQRFTDYSKCAPASEDKILKLKIVK